MAASGESYVSSSLVLSFISPPHPLVRTVESPAQFNQKIAQNAGVFQLAQTIPVTPYNYTTGAGGTADGGEWLIEQSGTDAAVLLTVYITNMAAVADQDLTDLGNQLKNCMFCPAPRSCFLACPSLLLLLIRYYV